MYKKFSNIKKIIEFYFEISFNLLNFILYYIKYMKEIPLIDGLTSPVDDEDFEWLNQWKWTAATSVYGTYAIRNIYINKKHVTLYMHKVILGIPYNSNIKGDHIDRNKLNNQRFNLRRATYSQNAINYIRKNSTGYRGVYYNIQNKKFQVKITINGKRKSLGAFTDIILAAQKYDKYAKKYQGEFAITNF